MPQANTSDNSVLVLIQKSGFFSQIVHLPRPEFQSFNTLSEHVPLPRALKNRLLAWKLVLSVLRTPIYALKSDAGSTSS